MVLYAVVAGLCVLAVWAFIWECRLWVRRSVRRDMAVWDAAQAKEER